MPPRKRAADASDAEPASKLQAVGGDSADTPKRGRGRPKKTASPESELPVVGVKTEVKKKEEIKDESVREKAEKVAVKVAASPAAGASIMTSASAIAPAAGFAGTAPTGQFVAGYQLRKFDDATEWKFVSWNVNGIRALLKTGNALEEIIEREKPHALCLQEVKCDADYKAELLKKVKGYSVYLNPSTAKRGYSGTAVLVRDDVGKNVKSIIGLDGKQDEEGRSIAIDFGDIVLVNTYVPNAGQDLKRLDYRVKTWDPQMFAFLKKLASEPGKRIVWTGDLNCAHHEIDIWNAKKNLKSAGFTPEERASFSTFVVKEGGWFDSFRRLYPTTVQYTYWNYRGNNRERGIGWRLDYFICSPNLEGKIVDSYVLDAYKGSDHCPVGVIIKKN